MSFETQEQLPNDVAISVRNLTKTYRLFDHPGDRVKQFLSFGFKRYHQEFTALKDISFDIKKGETVGIIGRNGSGKSTLLQLICGILKPSAGSVKVNGRISALLELGAGFNPEFTGRENVYFHGTLMGFSKKQMDERFEEIATFADIGEFIEQPVRTYSSGMFVKLALSVAINTDPDILIIDEALGVGDTEFQERSITRMKQMQRDRVTIIFVSHSIPAVRNFCQHAICLDRGVILEAGFSGDVCQTYLEKTKIRFSENEALEFTKTTHDKDKSVRINHIKLDKNLINVGDSLNVIISLSFSKTISEETKFGIGLIIKDENGQLVTLFNTVRDDIELFKKNHYISLNLINTPFTPGRYSISVSVCDDNILFPYDEMIDCLGFVVLGSKNKNGIPRWEGRLACKHAWQYE